MIVCVYSSREHVCVRVFGGVASDGGNAFNKCAVVRGTIYDLNRWNEKRGWGSGARATSLDCVAASPLNLL